jgi:ADP-dependent NAD(P)H-hydrate dehydratase / NAD(P)H-hydrate epimerase
VLGVAFAADRTVTFAFAKVGLVSHPGFERVGRLRVADIGIPIELAEQKGVTLHLLDDAAVAKGIPTRAAGAHKGSNGHALIVAGSPGKPGAALLCALGALRGGAGLVTVATAPDARAAVEGRIFEAMYTSADLERPPGEAVATLSALAAGKGAIACGPGIPSTAEARASVRAAVVALAVPLVLDADALNHIAPEPALLRAARAPAILTPHPGEAARLLGMTTAEIQGDRLAAARRLAAASGAIAILKGARTVIAAPDGRAAINPTGNPGMASGGSGDVLCGLVAALLCQGLSPYDAACAAVFVHGRAGDLAAARIGSRGLLAHDLAEHLPAAFVSLDRSR